LPSLYRRIPTGLLDQESGNALFMRVSDKLEETWRFGPRDGSLRESLRFCVLQKRRDSSFILALLSQHAFEGCFEDAHTLVDLLIRDDKRHEYSQHVAL